jgi:hypothetical protein
MSNEALNWAWASDLEPGPRFVLVALADQGQDHSGENWRCFPSIAKLMLRTGFSRPTIERHLKFLAADGWLTRARRRRADGTLGIYDFVLVRDRPQAGPAGCVSKEAKTAKSQIDQPVAEISEDSQPYVNLTCGADAQPPINLMVTTHQFDSQPPIKLMGQEPLVEPLLEPTQSAREPGDDGFEAGFGAYAESGRLRTRLPLARAAWALQRQSVGRPELIAAVVRYVAEDRDLRGGDHGAPGFDKWLSDERWRAWLAGPAAGAEVRVCFPDPLVRQALAAECGEAFAVSYLDRAGWDPHAREVAPSTGAARAKLAALPAKIFLDLNVTLAQGRSV